MVIAGVVVGAMAETDCARVSSGDNTARRRPNPEVSTASAAYTFTVSGGKFAQAPR
jgi:hypothetical protein